MKEYETVWEIFNECANNQMRDVFIDEIYTDEEDDWTVRTEDGLPSAQWEVTVLVTETGCEVICW